ncbi:MAG: nucleotidyltransferase family protein [Ilumatobacteraceae bacterium]
MPRWSLADVQATGLAAGLTALAGELGLFEGASAEVAAYIEEQRQQVAARVERFRALTPQVVGVLTDAAVPVVVVKGAALIEGVWGRPAARPMADIDLIVAAHHRSQAAAVMARAGWPLHSSTDYEDTFLAWGDGGAGRTDGESAAHNGRVEIHPGWVESLHGYTVGGFEVAPATFDHAALTVHVIGHLASTVVRAEVRAVNVVDVWWCAQRDLDWVRVSELMAHTDPRLTAPGLWLLSRVLPGLLPEGLLAAELARLPRRARALLHRTHAAEVLRDPATRTTAMWREAFARSMRERKAIVRQMMRPAGARRGVRATVTRLARR